MQTLKSCLLIVIAALTVFGCDKHAPTGHGNAAVPFVSFKPTRSDEVRIGSVIGAGGYGSSYVEWFVSTNVLLTQPKWDGLSAGVPLSPEKACSLAVAEVKKAVPEVESWAVESIYLNNLFRGGQEGLMFSYPNVWCYQITFMPSDSAVRTRSTILAKSYAMVQIVLLDGTVLTPQVLRTH